MRVSCSSSWPLSPTPVIASAAAHGREEVEQLRTGRTHGQSAGERRRELVHAEQCDVSAHRGAGQVDAPRRAPPLNFVNSRSAPSCPGARCPDVAVAAVARRRPREALSIRCWRIAGGRRRAAIHSPRVGDEAVALSISSPFHFSESRSDTSHRRSGRRTLRAGSASSAASGSPTAASDSDRREPGRPSPCAGWNQTAAAVAATSADRTRRMQLLARHCAPWRDAAQILTAMLRSISPCALDAWAPKSRVIESSPLTRLAPGRFFPSSKTRFALRQA